MKRKVRHDFERIILGVIALIAGWLLDGCATRKPIVRHEPHWGPRAGDPLPQGICSWCSQKGEWRCPDGSVLIDKRTGKPPLLGDEWDERMGPVMSCRKRL